MFYSTTIKKIGAGFAVDNEGKKLLFIGYLPVQEGDVVYTDGNVIFGNVKPRGYAPTLIDIPKGIPVLSDNLRGYFTQNGTYKRYQTAGSEWLVNDSSMFAHDSGGNIIDAEIATDINGNAVGVYTVRKNQSRATAKFADNTLYVAYNGTRKLSASFDGEKLKEAYKSYRIEERPIFEIEEQAAEYAKENGTVIKDCAIIIAKDGVEQKKISLGDLMKDIDMEKSTKEKVNVEISGHSAEDYSRMRARLLNFKVGSKGDWTALVECECFAERRMYSYVVYSVPKSKSKRTSEKTTVSGIDYASDTLKQAIMNVFSSLTAYKYLETITITYYIDHYEKKTGGNDGRLAATVAIEKCLFVINSSGVSKKIFKKGWYAPFVLEHSLSTVFSKVDTGKREFPYYTYLAYGGRFIGTMTYVNVSNSIGNFKRISESDDTKKVNYYCVESVYDLRYWQDAPDYDKETVTVEEYFFLPIQDGYFAKLVNVNNKNQWRLNGIYAADNNLIANISSTAVDVHKWNMSFVPLKNGGALFGAYGKELKKIDAANNSTIVGTGLKNFRLRELKVMSKAKK